MKAFNTILFLFLTVGLFAQSINQKDSKGRKQGPWQKQFEKSKVLEYKGQFKDDKPVGTFTYYYPSNKIKAIIKHDEVTKRSEAIFYHENGELMSYGTYKNYQKDSTWYHYTEAGAIVSTENYKNDLLEGVRTTYYPPNEQTGKVEKISSAMMYSNGLLNGEYKEYFDFGSVRVKGTYLDGKKHGVWEEYQPTGKLLAFTRYKNGLKHGWCSAYDATGKEVNKVYYYYGKLKQGKDLEHIMKQMKEKGINPNG